MSRTLNIKCIHRWLTRFLIVVEVVLKCQEEEIGEHRQYGAAAARCFVTFEAETAFPQFPNRPSKQD